MNRLVILARAAWAGNPVRVIAITTAVVVFLAAKLGLVLDSQDVGESLLLALPFLLGGEVTRTQVTPDPGPIGPRSDDLLEPPVQP